MASPENDLMPSKRLSGGSLGSRATPELMNVSPLSDGTPHLAYHEQSMEELLKRRERLYAQRNQLQAQLHTYQSQAAENIDKMSAKQLKKLYDQLREELLEKTVFRNGRELAKKGKCLNETLLSVLQCEVTGQVDPVILDQKREMEDLIDDYTTLASKVAQEHKENSRLKEHLEKIKTENFTLKKNCRKLYSEIEEKRKANEEELKALTTDATGRSIHEEMKSKLQLNYIQKNIQQMLILGSGLNWAQDEKLCKIMQDAGKSVDI